jgi:hypothetical protein
MKKLAARLFLITAMTAGMLALDVPASFTVEVPATLHAEMSVDAGGPDGAAPERLPFTATHLGVQWEGHEDPPPEIRTSADGSSWSLWRPVQTSEDMSDHTAGIFFSTLLLGHNARWVEVRHSAGSATEVLDLSVINTRDGPRRTVTVPRSASAATPQPYVISRAEWGADESLRTGSPSFARVRRLVVHHTVTANDDPDPAGTIRGIYAYHTLSRGWNDIGYNFLIDSSGRIYEGRFARSYGTEIPNGESLGGMGVIGAHATDFNTGSAGVALLGDFTWASPQPAAVKALIDLLAWKADRFGINPFGSDSSAPNIAGHRDVGQTGCPGGQLYEQLPSIRSAVEARIAATTGLTAPSMPTGTDLVPRNFSRDLTPNASGAVSRTAVRVELEFDGEGSASDRRFTLTPRDGSFALTDQDYRGRALSEGRYAVRAVAYDSSGRSSPVASVSSGYVVTLGEVPASGYWIMGTDGGIFSYGSAEFFGSTGGMRLNAPVVGMDARPAADGYWLVASDGGIFTFGEAGFYGSTGGMRLNKPVVGMARTPSGGGYWLVASDGGIFTFGDSGFFGSTGSMRLNQPIVGMAPTPTGGGYWLVASDGGIFTFGDAQFFGSTGGMTLNQPIVGMAPTRKGDGYWLVASDGGIFTFGEAGFFGSLPGRGVSTGAAGMAASFTGNGYYTLGVNGSMWSFGDAQFYGSVLSSGIHTSTRDLALVP